MFLPLKTSVPGYRMPGGFWQDPGDAQLGPEPLGISREVMKGFGYNFWLPFCSYLGKKVSQKYSFYRFDWLLIGLLTSTNIYCYLCSVFSINHIQSGGRQYLQRSIPCFRKGYLI